MHIDNEKNAIKEIVEAYFMGAYQGDAKLINQAFHPDAHITGIFNGQYSDWTLAEFIQRVQTSPTAAMRNEPFAKEIISMDITENAAMVKAYVKTNSHIFIDYITLLKINGQWIIRNKSFTTI